MTVQLTFQRGHYTGNWVADEPATPDHPVDDVTGSIFTPGGSAKFFSKAVPGIIPEETGSPPSGADYVGGRSGPLEILYKGVQEIVLHDKAEHAAEKVFTNYVTPDHQHMAEEIFYNFTARNISMARGIKAIAKDNRHIQHDVYVVRKILRSLLVGQGYYPGNYPELDDE